MAMAIEVGVISLLYLISSVIIALLHTISVRERLIDLIAATLALIGLLLNIKIFMYVNSIGLLVYRFGGFPPPLGVIYVVDGISCILALLASFALLLSLLFSIQFIEPNVKALYYVLAFLLTSGVVGSLFTGDIFNLYVSIELVAISSYAITSIHKDNPKAIRAAIIYGISGTIVTSFLLLVTFMVYGSYGTLNMADIALKASNIEAEVVFSGNVYGDIVFISKIVLALATWVFLFKSGIMPNHFWLPEVYKVAPLPAIAIFTASADIIGIYGLIRFYYTIFGIDTLVKDFRNTLLILLMIIGGMSTIVSAAFVSRQNSIRKLVAYSSISQFSLSLLGVTIGIGEAIGGVILHLISNGLGDMSIIFSAATIKRVARGKCSNRSMIIIPYIALVIGLLNLFGIIPLLPGFWSKTYLAMGFVKAGFPQGAAIVLISTGLCALGYMRMIIRYLPRASDSSVCINNNGVSRELVLPLTILIILVIVTIVLGIFLTAHNYVRDIFVSYGYMVMDSKRYIDIVFSDS
ncbi:MAG: proton-conducting transporter membrane subunit [Ignisphaera sp.]